MKIAFYKGLAYGRLIDRLVCICTLSKFSHCEIVFSDGLCVSSSFRDGGVRFKPIDLNHKWEVFEVECSVVEEESIRSFFNLHEDSRYNLIGALASWIGFTVRSNDQFFCSEIVAPVFVFNQCRNAGDLYSKMKRLGIINT